MKGKSRAWASRVLLPAVAAWLPVLAIAQSGAIPTGPQHPRPFDETSLRDAGARAVFESDNKLSPPAQEAFLRGSVVSVPYFFHPFAYQGQTFRPAIVGADPKNSSTTTIPTQIVPVSLYFEGWLDDQGKPLVLDITPSLAEIQESPNFSPASYGSGVTQFADAVQRAEFFSIMKPDWHTLLDAPQVLAPVTIDVPDNPAIAQVFRNSSTGGIFAVVDTSFFVSQLNTIVQLEHLDIGSLAVVLTRNVVLSTAPEKFPQRCCLLGFHTAYDAGTRDASQLVQTFVWASWIDQGVFASTFSDVTAVSHEISEWMNDPFGNNIVPSWQYPSDPGRCQSNLETGDPISVLANPSVEVAINGRLYHPQAQALIQWFSRESPSSALDGAYSFPNQGLLTSPAQACSIQ